MAGHFKDDAVNPVSKDGADSYRDLSAIGQEHEPETASMPATAESTGSEIVGIYHKHQSRASRRESQRRARGRRRNSHSRRHHHHRHRRVWPIVLVTVLLVLLAAAGVEGFLLYRSVQEARSEANVAMDGAKSYLEAAKAGDHDGLVRASQAVSESAHRLQRKLDDPQWNVASMVPAVGDDVKSVRVLAGVLADIADRALIPLAEGEELLSLSVLMDNSSVNMDALNNLINVVRTTTPVVTEAAETIEALPPAHIEQVSSILETTREMLSGAKGMLIQADPLLDDLPTLLGGNGQEKKYLILASNNAEVHAAGGFVGALGVLSVQDGRTSLGDFDSVWDVLPKDEVSAGATEEEIAVFGARVDTHHGDHTICPDFSRAGQLYYNIWDTARNEQLDGVIRVDSIFLQRMLALTGGIETSYGVTVDGTNAASYLLNECLFWWDPKVCDDFYYEVASTAFEKVLTNLGNLDLFEFLRTVMESAGEGRCNIWIHDEAIEERIKSAGLGWELPHDATKPLTGVFMSDASVSKGSYYVSLDTKVGDPSIAGDASKTYPVTATFKHNLDQSLANYNLPGYILSGYAKVVDDPRSIVELQEEITLIAPEGGRISNIRIDSWGSAYGTRELTLNETSYQGLNTWHGAMRIDPGETYELHYDVTCSPAATEELVVRQTPVVPHDVRGD